ncbi:MAG: enolase C-terminal domain-like protein [Janthinobacterium lividum]
MRRAAADAAERLVLKTKLGGADDEAALAAVRDAAPEATLIVDANEGWTEPVLASRLAACHRADVAMVEQPLPAGHDAILARIARPVPVCADESAHVAADLVALRDRYDAVNVKLDKAGGLTAALEMVEEAERLGFGVMVGSMLGSSLGVAPALLLTPRARFVDLDGPLLLARDRDPGLRYDGSVVLPAEPEVWG